MIQLWPWILVLCDARCSEHIYSNSEPLPTKLTVIQFMTVEIRLLMETPHKHVDPCVTWLVGKCSSSRWWVSWGEWQVCPPLCLIQWRSCVLEFLLCESWATRRSHVNAVFVWTVPGDRSCCCLREQRLHFRLWADALWAAFYSRKLLTWHISCQEVQTCDLSVMCPAQCAYQCLRTDAN